MAVQRIDHINLSASGPRFRALRDFYCDVLELQPGVRPPLRSEGLWLYAEGAPIVHLVERPKHDEPEAQSIAPMGLDHVALRCSNLEQTVERLRQLGVAHRVSDTTAAGQVLIRLEDPSGLTLELVFDQSEQPL